MFVKNLLTGIPRKYCSKIKAINRNKISTDILANTLPSRKHLTPEIVLRLITPECKMYFEPFSEENPIFTNDPFWGFYWPGGQAISRYLLDNPEVVKNQRILDFGSGSGACSIAAAKCGATYALANDIDEVACIAAKINSEMNAVQISTSCENLIGTQRPENVILVGDLFYDSEFAAILIPWLKELRRNGKCVLIGDPGRHGITQEFQNCLVKLATFDLPENCCIENNGFKSVHVWRFC